MQKIVKMLVDIFLVEGNKVKVSGSVAKLVVNEVTLLHMKKFIENVGKIFFDVKVKRSGASVTVIVTEL